ncbi:YxeA family protein [Lactiplantibacillus plantarum]|uniref:YxeA family protein n=2 Tax=Lactiplantibacillus plantarum TaxID=1590 RepID=UPI001BA78A91|nr:YxeA family protein [Lactiplantibacillus plantarum]MBS0956778.1 YxeA family protein [Lactiplantibacillus plantarum]
MSKLAIKGHWIETILVALLVGVTILSVGWHIYRYGGDYYYMEVNGSSGSFPVTVPVGITQNGYVYRGTAKDKYGNRKHLEFRTVADDLGPFHKGQIIRVTYNLKFGVTNYKEVNRDHVPPLARFD